MMHQLLLQQVQSGGRDSASSGSESGGVPSRRRSGGGCGGGGGGGRGSGPPLCRSGYASSDDGAGSEGGRVEVGSKRPSSELDALAAGAAATLDD